MLITVTLSHRPIKPVRPSSTLLWPLQTWFSPRETPPASVLHVSSSTIPSSEAMRGGAEPQITPTCQFWRAERESGLAMLQVGWILASILRLSKGLVLSLLITHEMQERARLQSLSERCPSEYAVLNRCPQRSGVWYLAQGHHASALTGFEPESLPLSAWGRLSAAEVPLLKTADLGFDGCVARHALWFLGARNSPPPGGKSRFDMLWGWRLLTPQFFASPWDERTMRPPLKCEHQNPTASAGLHPFAWLKWFPFAFGKS